MTTTPSVTPRMFALEVPDDARLGALAAEASLTDPGLDALEARVSDPSEDLHARLGTALQVARAGRHRSGPTLAGFRRELLDRDHRDEARVVRAAIDLLALHPPARLERADRGYRWRDEEAEIYVEDPLAEHWHAAGRWGPPLRPDLERPPRYFGAQSDEDELRRFALDGGIVVVTYERGGQPALRVTRAGFARDAALSTLIRWSDLASWGWLEGARGRSLAYEVRGQSEAALPPAPSCGDERLLALIRACSAPA